MNKSEKENWILNIENSASVVASEIGQETVDFIFQKYGAKSVYDLNPCDYQNLWNELYFYEIDTAN